MMVELFAVNRPPLADTAALQPVHQKMNPGYQLSLAPFHVMREQYLLSSSLQDGHLTPSPFRICHK